MDIETVMDRYGINLSAARVLKVIDRLVYASRLRGVKDRRGIPYCYASKEWIAGKIGKSVRTVARAIRDLKAAGLIECKRTRSNAMLFITGYDIYGVAEPEQTASAEPEQTPRIERIQTARAKVEQTPETATVSCAHESAACGTSGSDQNGTSKIRNQSNNITKITNQSINLTPRPEREKRDRSAHLDHSAEEDQTAVIQRERFEADRWRLLDQLRRRWINNPWDMDDSTSGAIMATARYIADTVASKRDICVNGVSLSAEQYWDVVRNVSADQLRGTIKAIAARDCVGRIRNKRAYLLSSVYNCALWERFNEVEPNMREMVRLAEGAR